MNLRPYDAARSEYLMKEYLEGKSPEKLNAVINSYLGLVQRMVLKKFTKTSLISEEDLIQVGYIALIKAIPKYDPTKNMKFHNYLMFFLRDYLGRYIKKQGSLVSVSSNDKFWSRKDRPEVLASIRTISMANYNPTDDRTLEETLKDDVIPIDDLLSDSDYIKKLIKKVSSYYRREKKKQNYHIVFLNMLGRTEFTQKQLGEKLGVTTASVQNYTRRINEYIRQAGAELSNG